MFSVIPISSASQHDLQAFLDQHQFNRHFASCSIRDRAKLTALSHSSGTSSGWLKAIPSTSLGLAIPGPEFIVGLRLWLGVSLFPITPLCTCLSSIDCFGDHLLGCSHGPMRIRRHDALVNIFHYALLQDHPGVLKEQRASFDDSSRPGDIFHPDYQLGHPAYFDVSVCSTTQPAHISLYGNHNASKCTLYTEVAIIKFTVVNDYKVSQWSMVSNVTACSTRISCHSTYSRGKPKHIGMRQISACFIETKKMQFSCIHISVKAEQEYPLFVEYSKGWDIFHTKF